MIKKSRWNLVYVGSTIIDRDGRLWKVRTHNTVNILKMSNVYSALVKICSNSLLLAWNKINSFFIILMNFGQVTIKFWQLLFLMTRTWSTDYDWLSPAPLCICIFPAKRLSQSQPLALWPNMAGYWIDVHWRKKMDSESGNVALFCHYSTE